MKIKELKEMLKNQNEVYVDIEVYMYIGKVHKMHTDFIKNINDYNDNMEVIDYQLMDEQEYSHTIDANSSIVTNFEEWYDQKDVKVLVVVVKNEID